MALQANALTKLATFKDYLGVQVGDVTLDTRYEFFIDAASGVIESYVERHLLEQTYTERQDGRLSDTLIPRQWPVQSVTEVRVAHDWDFTLSTTLLEANDYSIEKDSIIRLRHKIFPKGKLNIQIVYVAGYKGPASSTPTLPKELELCCLQLAEWYMTIRDDRRVGVTNKSKSGENIGFVGDLPGFIQTVLDNYTRAEFAGGLSASVGNG